MKRTSSFSGSRKAVIASLALGVCLGGAARADTIEFMDGKQRTDVEIKDAKWDVVTYTITGAAASKTDKKGKLGQQSAEGYTIVALDRASQALAAAYERAKQLGR